MRIQYILHGEFVEHTDSVDSSPRGWGEGSCVAARFRSDGDTHVLLVLNDVEYRIDRELLRAAADLERGPA